MAANELYISPAVLHGNSWLAVIGGQWLENGFIRVGSTMKSQLWERCLKTHVL